jgi:hypothetical protein
VSARIEDEAQITFRNRPVAIEIDLETVSPIEDAIFNSTLAPRLPCMGDGAYAYFLAVTSMSRTS